MAFASIADRVSLDLTAPPQVTVAGPFAGAIVGANILDRTLALLSARSARSAPGRRPPSQGIAGCSRPRGRLGQCGGLVEGGQDGQPRACSDCRLARVVRRARRRCRGLPGRQGFVGGRYRRQSQAARGSVAAAVPGHCQSACECARGQNRTRVSRAWRASAAAPAAARPRFPFIKDRAGLIALMRERGNALAGAALSVVPEMATRARRPRSRARRRDRRRVGSRSLLLCRIRKPSRRSPGRGAAEGSPSRLVDRPRADSARP